MQVEYHPSMHITYVRTQNAERQKETQSCVLQIKSGFHHE